MPELQALALIMTLKTLLESLTDQERDFIAGLDCGNDAQKHRQQLDIVIQNGGEVDMKHQIWCPYEVIELGKNHLQKGHEREYAACLGVVFTNLLKENDRMNDVDMILENQMAEIDSLPVELRQLLHSFIDEFIKKS